MKFTDGTKGYHEILNRSACCPIVGLWSEIVALLLLELKMIDDDDDDDETDCHFVVCRRD